MTSIEPAEGFLEVGVPTPKTNTPPSSPTSEKGGSDEFESEDEDDEGDGEGEEGAIGDEAASAAGGGSSGAGREGGKDPLSPEEFETLPFALDVEMRSTTQAMIDRYRAAYRTLESVKIRAKKEK